MQAKIKSNFVNNIKIDPANSFGSADTLQFKFKAELGKLKDLGDGNWLSCSPFVGQDLA
ncbi:hypothetical protein [Neptunicoccus cionae]|uniref:hypothetical protein n=1 Tax=Neptunicoccus cionae TaxID=2035344 RepID=UPI0015E0DEED|nr:hypothetical protein [Amylibacter cionae]